MSTLHQIALTFIPGIGDVLGKNLVAVCGGAEAVFKENRKALLRAEGIGETLVNIVLAHREAALDRAAREIEFIEKYKITTLFYTDKSYPKRLKECIDGPLLIYYKGNADLNDSKVVAIVGTRRATTYGKEICFAITEGLASLNVLVVSGLAYGIDACAHKAALDVGLNTVGVLAHGLDRIYPATNKPLAGKMVHRGGLITDYPSNTNPDRENFPTRNRIIAGLSDAIVVVEGGKKGGALITAEIANSYNRDVFSVPGRIGDYFSEGCNYLIKTNRAHLIQSAADIKYIMGWDDLKKSKPVQQKLMLELNSEEAAVIEVLKNSEEASIDKVCSSSGLSPTKAASALLNLEFEGLIRCLPGKMYRLN
ncbi:MAG: DNA-processing protein DprA [Bacteroidales bacterium]|nr:DNA-processing protein DprA [Bacteroidales bacterium]MDZ4204048.1 DNA-processing protein DprA [Bacteroidales bacterium]